MVASPLAVQAASINQDKEPNVATEEEVDIFGRTQQWKYEGMVEWLESDPDIGDLAQYSPVEIFMLSAKFKAEWRRSDEYAALVEAHSGEAESRREERRAARAAEREAEEEAEEEAPAKRRGRKAAPAKAAPAAKKATRATKASKTAPAKKAAGTRKATRGRAKAESEGGEENPFD